MSQQPHFLEYIKKSKMLIQKNICTPVFIAALFTIDKIWKQPKCPTVDEGIKKLWYIYTMECHSARKKEKKKRKEKDEEIIPFAIQRKTNII